MKKLVLLMLASLTLCMPAQGMQPPDLPTYINRTTIAAMCAGIILLAITIFTIKKILTKINDYSVSKNFSVETSIPESVQKFINTVVEQRDVKDITFYVTKKEKESYCTSPTRRIIGLSQKDVDELERIINKTDEESIQKKYLHSCFIHHELTHIERNPHTKCSIAAAIGLSLSLFASTTLLAEYNQNNPSLVTRIISCIGGLGGLCLSHICIKYEEMKADDGIPEEKKLLKVAANYYNKVHQSTIKYLKQNSHTDILYSDLPILFRGQLLAAKTIPTKYFENSSLLTEFLLYASDSHPSCLFRARRFEKRIAAIEAAEKSKAQNQ